MAHLAELLARPALSARRTGGRRAEVLNYRRFFDVDTLIARPGRAPRGLRRDPCRCCSTCTAAASSTASGSTIRTGSPIPRATSSSCTTATDGAWVVVEKILEPGRAAARAAGRAPARPATTRSRSCQAPCPAGGLPLDAALAGDAGGDPSLPACRARAASATSSTSCSQPEVRRLVRGSLRPYVPATGTAPPSHAVAAGGRSPSCSRTSTSTAHTLRPGHAAHPRAGRAAGARWPTGPGARDQTSPTRSTTRSRWSATRVERGTVAGATWSSGSSRCAGR